MVALTITGSAYAAESAKPEAKCYTNKEFMKYIDDNHLVTLYAGETTTGKTQEILLSNDRRSVTVEYIKPKEGATASDQYCVISVIHDVTFNDSAIEFLSKLLDKVRGQKV
jgi:ribosomal protein S24E